ncbi:tRNA1(Val) (adenine(37)-N6)-methyltransferase [Segetibacter koreensis]|uniref:tRNA1(Val) (adenine(37)-N6)-methyltransferase n=1 Tax=Segetibacter koreensis TaxID=398037 RepID=UPI00037FD3F6|nr:methyltransferase [Segetibacter koreensis]
MANSYFRFKQFTVHQAKSAMKVCTDACVFGAYVSLKEKACSNEETNILDIGTGSGLLSLMIAQRVNGNIEAVEIDDSAFEQANENFEISPWQKRLTAIHADITQLSILKKYDIIVSNPPFFQKSLKSDDLKKNLAKHTTTLPYTALASIACSHLAEKGKFYILLPFEEFIAFEKIALENKLKLFEKVNIRQHTLSNYFRTIGVFTNVATPEAVTEHSISIKDKNDAYTESFIELLKDYYLYL